MGYGRNETLPTIITSLEKEIRQAISCQTSQKPSEQLIFTTATKALPGLGSGKQPLGGRLKK